MTAAVITHSECSLHDNGDNLHPESPDRLDAIKNQLISSGLDWVLMHYDAPKAEKENLYRVHDKEYVERVFNTAPNEGQVMLDEDTGMNPHTLDAALRSAGAVIKAVDLAMTGERKRVFCAVRPPGHHARKKHAAGFCIFNNVNPSDRGSHNQYTTFIRHIHKRQCRSHIWNDSKQVRRFLYRGSKLHRS